MERRTPRGIGPGRPHRRCRVRLLRKVNSTRGADDDGGRRWKHIPWGLGVSLLNCWFGSAYLLLILYIARTPAWVQSRFRTSTARVSGVFVIIPRDFISSTIPLTSNIPAGFIFSWARLSRQSRRFVFNSRLLRVLEEESLITRDIEGRDCTEVTEIAERLAYVGRRNVVRSFCNTRCTGSTGLQLLCHCKSLARTQHEN